MANFSEAYKILMQVEYSSRPDKFLHLNYGESGYTIGGIYQKYHPSLIDWGFIDRVIKMCRGDIAKASSMLFFDKDIQKQVMDVFKDKYWNKNRLSEVPQLIANEIFIFAVNVGNQKAVQKAQEVANDNCGRCLAEDGILGFKTIIALNDIDVVKFSNQYDQKEQKYYEIIVDKNPDLAKNLNGWINRSEVV
jgi:lysozyme family protein